MDNPNSFTFSLPNQLQKTQLQTKPPPISAPVMRQPIVELNVPPFLPTPYKPDVAIPTSATQKEASTVFSKVSSKLNKQREEAILNSPLFFDVKEVSTHYPIVGKPSFQSNTLTGSGIDNDDISNEVPTTKPTVDSSTQKPRRRKPKPRRPVVVTTTEQSITQSSELQKISESVEVQTERPRKRQRVRPQQRTTTEKIDDILKHRTTTEKVQSEEISSERSRGRNRYRHKSKYITISLKSNSSSVNFLLLINYYQT